MASFIIIWIILEYLTYCHVVGQNTIISALNQTFPVCTSDLCDSARCGEPAPLATSCKCDYACVFFGDCCADFDAGCRQGIVNDPPFEDVVQPLKRSQASCVTLPGDSGDYWMVTTCPSSWSHDAIRSLCEDDHSAMSADLTTFPVADGGLLTYRNVYCAVCNGLDQETLTAWNLVVQCTKEVTDEVRRGTTSLAELLNNGDCEFLFEPPVNSSLSVSRTCLSGNYVDQCPESSDETMKELCSLYQGVSTDEGGLVYRNPYCQICNTELDLATVDVPQAVIDICEAARLTSTRRPPENMIPTKPTPRRGGWQDGTTPSSNTSTGDRGVAGNKLQPLSIVMDFTRGSRIQVKQMESLVQEVEVSCRQGEVFDPFTEECWVLSCPEGYELRDNVCHRLSPPVNLTCGTDNQDLNVILSVTVSMESAATNTCLTANMINNVTIFIEHALYLPAGTLTLAESFSDTDEMKKSSNSNCTLLNNTISIGYNIDHSLISYADLENAIDRSFRQEQSTSSMSGYRLKTVMISQQCLPVTGLSGCPSGSSLLPEASVIMVNDSMVVHDNATGNLYHPYETLFTSTYDRQADGISVRFNKSFVIEICNQKRLSMCSLITQPSSFFLPLDSDGKYLNNTVTGEILSPDEYTLTADGRVQYCASELLTTNTTFNKTTEEQIFTYDETQVILSFVGVSISLIALLVTFATYCIFPHMRRCVSNKLIMVLCASLFLAQLLQMLSGLGTSIPELCTALSALSHFLWISVFATTSCLAFELSRTLGARESLTLTTNSSRFVLSYVFFIIMTSSVLVGTCLAIHFTVGEELHFAYGSEAVCWIVDQKANLAAFGCPLGIFLIVNTILFLRTVTGIRNATKVRQSMLMESQNIKETAKELRVYLKISTLLGFTWLFGFIPGFTGINWMWYVFIVLNSLQGFYIFLAFMANKRFVTMWATLLCYCSTSGHLKRSRGNSSVPLSQRMTRLTSLSSLPRNSEYKPGSEKKQQQPQGEKAVGSQRYKGVNNKINDRRTSGGEQGSPNGDRRYSHGEWKYAGDRKLSGDRKYLSASDRRQSGTGKNAQNGSNA